MLTVHELIQTQAALFPCGISLAATWNKELLHEVGQHLADETRARSAEMLLAPTVCMHRHPLGGRNFESFSEDPLLTGKLAAQYIMGLQEKGVAATIKRESWSSTEITIANHSQTSSETSRKRIGLPSTHSSPSDPCASSI